MLPDAPVTPVRLFTPLSIVMEVAPLVTQVSVAEPPDAMLGGERYRAATGSDPEAATTSTFESEVLP
jgi:hypothetical protein